MTPEELLLQCFPRLKDCEWRISSCPNREYNCIAFAAGDESQWWGIDYDWYWPDEVDRQPGIAYLIAAYRAHGFTVCDDADGQTFDPEFDKLVVYEWRNNWKHAAKLVRQGMWMSKLGRGHDIEHETPEAVSGATNGNPYKYMKRPKG